MSIESLKQELLKTYRYTTELHAHTAPCSHCSDISPKEMVQTYSELGYDAVAIPNHFMQYPDQSKEETIDAFIRDYELTCEEAAGCGLKIIFGAEIRFTENVNDYLLFGIRPEMMSDIYDLLPYGLENFRKEWDFTDSILIQAHPFRNGMTMVDSSLLDGVEAFNMHPNHNSRNATASKWAKNEGLCVITAGSDFHHYAPFPGQGLSAILTKECPENSYDIVKVLRSKDYLLQISQNNIIIP